MIAKKLKELREKKEMSQAELANILDVAQQTVASWEREKSSPNHELLLKLADFFHVSTDELLGRDTFKPNLFGNDENSAMMKYIKENNLDGTIKSFLRLSPEVREQAQSYIDYLVKKDAEARVKIGSVQAGRNFAG